jgi:hypothetical protein
MAVNDEVRAQGDIGSKDVKLLLASDSVMTCYIGDDTLVRRPYRLGANPSLTLGNISAASFQIAGAILVGAPTCPGANNLASLRTGSSAMFSILSIRASATYRERRKSLSVSIVLPAGFSSLLEAGVEDALLP